MSNSSTPAPDDIAASYRLLFEGVQELKVGVSIYDDRLRLVVCNACFREIFSLTEAMVQAGTPLGMVLRHLAEQGVYGPVDAEAFENQALFALRQVDCPFVFERRVADGRIFESQTSRLASGGYITIHTDITHHKEAEQKLRENQAILSEKTKELELILENASLGILTVIPGPNEWRLMRRVNRALEKLLGYAHGELEGQATRMLYPNESEYAAVSAGYNDVVCCGGTYQAEHIFARKDGSTLVGILRGSAIDPEDRGRGAIWLIEDISERKRIEAELVAKTALLQAGTENMPGAMVIWDRELRYLWWTPRAERYFNLPPGTLQIGLPMESMARYFAERGDFGPGDIEEQIAMQMRPFYAHEEMRIERYMPDGSVLDVRRNPLPDGGFVSVFQDITARKRMESELRAAKEAAENTAAILRQKQEQVATLLDSSGQGFLSFGPDFRVDSEFSLACRTFFGDSPAGRDISALLLPQDKEARRRLRQQFLGVMTETDASERAFLLLQLPAEFRHESRILEADFRMLANGRMMAILTDATEKRRFQDLSMTDRLTGLANRRKLDDLLANEHERANRARTPFSLIVADIDRFKAINDEHGHQVGDRILVELAQLLQQGIRKIDAVGRWGGEEFMVICPDTDLDGAAELAEKLRAAICAHRFAEIERLACSFGAAQYRPGEHIDELFRRTDEALYRAKQDGRNRVKLSR